MDIGSRLRYWRERKNISGKALAEKVGLVPSQIYKIEGNVTKPSLDSLEKICDVLGITLAEFFADDISELPPDLHQLLSEVETLTPTQRQKLVEFIRSMKGE